MGEFFRYIANRFLEKLLLINKAVFNARFVRLHIINNLFLASKTVLAFLFKGQVKVSEYFGQVSTPLSEISPNPLLLHRELGVEAFGTFLQSVKSFVDSMSLVFKE